MTISDTIRAVIRYKTLVLLFVVAAALLSLYAVWRAPLDAIPDISDPQIIVYSKWARSPQLLETEVTAPLIDAFIGLPGVNAVRGTSHMGYSFVYVILNEASDRKAVEQTMVDRIDAIRARLPADASIAVGPNASSVGWIYQYALIDKDGTRDLRELRLLNESVVKPALQNTSGVAEIASVGGLETQYQIKLYPPLLASAGLSLRDVIVASQQAFQEAGGRTIDLTNREYQLRGAISGGSIDKLELLVVGRNRDGQAVRLKDIGYVQLGYDIRRGIAELNGTGEVVGGIVIMEHGQNVLAVTSALDVNLARLAESLPSGLQIVPTYDRASLVKETLAGFTLTLLYELLVTIAVVLLFLRNLRSAIAPIAILLLATLFTVLPMAAFGQTINLLSLAGLAIAIGEMIDATIVIVENCTAELAARGAVNTEQKRDVIVRAIASVTRPLLFSLLIILASFLPVFFMGEREARLFDPLAFTKTSAMAFSTVLTLVLLPILVMWIFRKHMPKPLLAQENKAVRGYRMVLRGAIRYRYAVIGASIAAMIPAVVLLVGFRSDYMPELEEGSVLYMPTTLPGLPTREAGWVLQQMDARLKAFPEVERVFGKLGRADTGTDPAPVSMIETTILLKPQSQWREGMTKPQLIAEMNDALQVTGYVNSWSQPISTRVVMQDTGIQTPVGIKVKGDDLSVVESLSKQIEQALRDVPGTTSVIAERISEGYFVDSKFDSVRMAEHNVTVDEAMSTLRYGVGGENFTRIKQADASLPLALQYSSEYVDTLDKVRNAPVVTEDGRSVPMQAIADVGVRKLPEMIRNDSGKLAGYVYIYLRDTTPADYIERARPVLAQAISLPPGYEIEWTGIGRYTEEARARLRYVVPLTVLIIFALLWMAFKSLADTAFIMLSIPIALIGGVYLQAALGYSMTTAVIIGYVALFAVAIQTGIVMVVFIQQALAARTGNQSYVDAVIDGSVLRLRPKLMTVAATFLSLLPVMVSMEQGMELMKPIATPTFGGMVSSIVFVLILIPCLFVVGEDVRQWRAKRHAHH